jgi:hypothetical protein
MRTQLLSTANKTLKHGGGRFTFPAGNGSSASGPMALCNKCASN